MNKLIYIFLFFLFLTSCVEEIQPKLEEEYEPELVVNSVVVPGEDYVQFFISTSVAIDSDDVPFHPVNGEAEVRLRDQSGEVVVEYVPSDEVWRTSRTYQPQPGFNFELEVELTSRDIATVVSTTFVPFPMPIENFNTNSSEQVVVAGKTKYNYNIDFNIPESEEDVHFRFIAKNPTTGEEIPVHSAIQGADAMSRLNHMQGVLFNSNTLIDGNVELILQSETDLSNAEIHLYTVNSEYYKYNRSLSDAYGSHNSPFDEPVSRYSNIDNGLGLFGSFTRYIKLYSLK